MNTVTTETLKWTHLGAMLLHLAQGAGGEAVINTVYKDQGYFVPTNTVWVPPNRFLGNTLSSFQLTQLVPVFSFLSSLNHAWAFFDTKRYNSYVAAGYNPVRWAEYGLSAGLMNIVIASLSGWTDVKGYAFLAAANMALQYTGYSVEQDTARFLRGSESIFRKDTRPFDLFQKSALRWSAIKQQVIGFAIFAAIMVPIWTAFFTAVASEDPTTDDSAPSFVWAIIFILTAFYLSFGIVSLAYTLQWKNPSFRTIELAYLILSFTSKTFLANMTLFGAASR